MSVRAPRGTGPGAITPDGCAVDLYALVPAGADPGIVDAAVPAGASILELGCGTGRILRPLAGLGHPVVGVDESPEMLAHLGDLPGVCARIQDLRLDRPFDAVLLAGNLVNTPDRDLRHEFLAACRRHVRPDGVVVIRQFPPAWFDRPRSSTVDDGVVRYLLRDVEMSDPLVSAVMEYRVGERVWTHEFTTRRLSTDGLDGALADAGLVRGQWLTDDRAWFTAAPG